MPKPEPTILSVSPFPEDHEALGGVLERYRWTILPASTLSLAQQILRASQIGIVVSERDIPPHSWKDLLVEICNLANPPFLIVTSLHADDYLWAEALNLGAYDVLAKPFEDGEVRRSIGIAALHWRWNNEPGLPPVLRAAGA